MAETPMQLSLDLILPPTMAEKAEDLGVKKANMNVVNMFVLAILAGAFIAIGAIFATTVSAGSMSINTATADLAYKTAWLMDTALAVVFTSTVRSCRGADCSRNNLFVMAI